MRCGRATIAVIAALTAWTVAVGGGLVALGRYEHGAGTVAAAPAVWPSASALEHAGRPTLVLVAHPLCPCTRASIAELAEIMTRTRGGVDAYVLLVRHPGLPRRDGIEDLAAAAAAIPGVRVREDPDGVEARRFGAATSGQTLLYGGDRALRFSGGITAARGHEGGNAGVDAVVALARGEAAAAAHPVYGCPLFGTGCPACAAP
jgi:hypothetical protein